jgi:hypothetical protein
VTALTCIELADLAPELALELLAGDERAAALAHVQRCDSCQQLVSALTDTTDRLLLLAPSAEPPPGFERRVLAAVNEAATRRARRPRRAVATAIALAAAALLVFVVVLGRSPERSFATADMRAPTGEVVGRVLVEPDRPAAVFMTLPGWTEQLSRSGNLGYTYSLRIARDDGPPQILPLTMTTDSTWSTTVDFDPSRISSIAVIDEQGRVWCQADM